MASAKMRSTSAKPGSRASLAAVAKRAGVSISTVSRIVNGIVGRASAETVERVRQAVDELGYRPDRIGRAMRQRQSNVVALLAPNLANPAMSTIAASTEEALRRAGHVMVLCDTHDRADLQDEYLAAMDAQLVRSVIFLGAVASPALKAASEEGEVFLFVNRRNPHDERAPFVGIDNRGAGAAVAAHFLASGHAPLAIIHSDHSSSAVRDRTHGFVDVLTKAGIAPEALMRLSVPGDVHLDIGYQAAGALLTAPQRPRAVLCTSDLIAYGAHRRLTEAGLAVPGDVVLVGIDGNPINPWLAPWLSSVVIPYEDYGPVIVDSLERIWAGEDPGERLLPYAFG